jgi:phenylalanyl-tRNA synthetase beta chain
MFDADAKLRLRALLVEAGAPIMLQTMVRPANSSRQSATFAVRPKNVLARLGALHPKTLAAFDVTGPGGRLDAIPMKKGGAASSPAPLIPRLCFRQ